MMSKYHINNKGEPALCKARVDACPLGGDHFDTPEEARKAFESVHEAIPRAEKRKWSKDEIVAEGVRQRQLLEKHILNRTVLTDEEYETRREYIRQVNNSHPSTHKENTRKVKGKVQYTPERLKQHDEIVSKLTKRYQHVPKEGKVFMTGGMPGSGKTTLLKMTTRDHENEYAVLNPDDIKELMAEKQMTPEIEGLTPLETNSLIQYESQVIYKKLYDEVTKDRTNVIIDKTMTRPNPVRKEIKDLKSKGYTEIKAIFADVSPDKSYERIVTRHREGINEYISSSGETYGDRVVSGSVIFASKTETDGYRSQNSEVMTDLTNEGVFTVAPRIFDTSGSEPKEITIDELSTAKF